MPSENRRPAFRHEERANPIGYNQYKHGGAGKNGPVLPGGKTYAQSMDAAAAGKQSGTKFTNVSHPKSGMGAGRPATETEVASAKFKRTVKKGDKILISDEGTSQRATHAGEQANALSGKKDALGRAPSIHVGTVVSPGSTYMDVNVGGKIVNVAKLMDGTLVLPKG